MNDSELVHTKLDPVLRASAKSGPLRLARPDAGGGAALYLQVARILRDAIVGGDYAVGSKIPTEEELAEHFTVCRHTVRAALRVLRDDGLIESRRKSGTIVVPSRASGVHLIHATSINDLAHYAAGAHFELEAMTMDPMLAEHAALIGLAVDEPWLTITGFAREQVGAVPFCFTRYYIHKDFAAIGRLVPRHSGALFPLIEDMFGQSIAEVHQNITGGVIAPAMSGTFEVEPQSASIVVSRVYHTRSRKIAQVTIDTHPASRFRHSLTMRRETP